MSSLAVCNSSIHRVGMYDSWEVRVDTVNGETEVCSCMVEVVLFVLVGNCM